MHDSEKQLRFLFSETETFEVCVFGTKVKKHALWNNEYAGGKKPIIGGWYNDIDKAVKDIVSAEKIKPIAIYTTLNPCTDALLARSHNRFSVLDSRTQDKEISQIKHILIDIDPDRPAGISSSDYELEQARGVANEIYKDLKKRGWSDPLTAMSGNGCHFIYKVDNVDHELIKGTLKGLSNKYSTDLIKIDTTVHNPARLVKIYGTTARKGEDIPDRPHRLAKIIKLPDNPISVDAEYLFAVAEAYKPEEIVRKHSDSFDVEDYLSQYGIECCGSKRNGSSTLFKLKECVFDPSHSPNEAAIGQMDDGKLFYQCFHNSCESRTWHDARQLISGNDYITKNTSNTSNTSNESGHKQNTSKTQARHKQDTSNADLYQDIKGWILESVGIFNTSIINQEFDLRTREQKNVRSQVLNRLKKQGLITQNGTRRGEWRVKQNEIDLMDVFSVSDNSITMPFPLGISNLCKVYPKSIVIIAGSSNSGKSAYASSLIHNIYSLKDYVHDLKVQLGMEKEPQVWYFNSEMGPEELRSRWSNFEDMDVFKKCKVVSRSQNFQDVIDPNGINIIDFMEVYDNFWEIGGWIRDVYDKLDKGIAVICIQKKRGVEIARGGEITLEKARLYIALDENKPYGGICKIVKAKSFVDPTNNPNGQEIDFKLVDGCKFITTSDWRYVGSQTERDKENQKHVNNLMTNDKSIVVEFECVDGTARLNRKDYEKWQDNFKNINIHAEIKNIVGKKPWMEKQKWFHQLSAMLANRNKEAGKIRLVK